MSERRDINKLQRKIWELEARNANQVVVIERLVIEKQALLAELVQRAAVRETGGET